MWYEFLLEGLKKFSGEIIGLILLAVFWRMFPGLRNWFKKLKKDDADDADVKEALERIQRQLEARQENIKPVEAHNADDIQKQQLKTRKFIIAALVIIAIICLSTEYKPYHKTSRKT